MRVIHNEDGTVTQEYALNPYSHWPAQPIGEYPDVNPTVAPAFRALDELCAQVESLQAANDLLAKENDELRQYRDGYARMVDYRIEMSQALAAAVAERDEARADAATAKAVGDRRGW